jgi:hypothetical protein
MKLEDVSKASNGRLSSQLSSGPSSEIPRPEISIASPNPELKKMTLLQKLFSFPTMLGGLLVAGVFVMRRDFQVDPDLWWHLKVGQNILATHRWPTTDPYSFTAAGQPWLAAEWLGDVLFAIIARIGGLSGLQALLIVLGASVILALYGYAALRSRNSKAGFLTATGLMFLATLNFNLRPQMLGYLFVIFTLIALERFRQGKPTAIWFLPALFLIWINTHGSWEIGLGMILVYWWCGLKEKRFGDIEMRAWKPDERKRLSLIFLLCLLVIPITPYGTQLAAYPFDVASSLPLNLAHIEEWLPMPFNLFGPKLFLALVLGTIAIQVAYQFKWRMEDFLFFCGATVMAFVHRRFLLIFVPIFAPILASMLARWVPGYHREKDPYVLNAVLMAAMLVAMVHYFPSRVKTQENVAEHFPVGAVKYLKNHPVSEPMFNSYEFGGYLVYSRGDEHKVFIDGRGELYERGGVYADYLQITKIKPGLLSVMRNYRIESCLIGREDPLAVFLTARPGWRQVYADPVSAIFVRSDSLDAATTISR